MTEEELNYFMETHDINKDGVINLTEFIDAVVNKKQILTEENMLKAFQTIDTNGSRTLSCEEL